MVRDVSRTRFLTTLEVMGGSAGNGRLQTGPGWQEATYRRVQPALVEEGLITKGRGRGGWVGLANGELLPTPPASPKPAWEPRPPRAVTEPIAKRQPAMVGSSAFQQI